MIKWVKNTLYWSILLTISLYAPIVYAQAAQTPDAGSETPDVYYSGSIQAICEKADSEKETLVDSKDYCKAYPKNCIGSQAVCLNGMPVNDNAALEHEADVMGEKAVTQRMENVGNGNRKATCKNNQVSQMLRVINAYEFFHGIPKDEVKSNGASYLGGEY